MKNLKNHPVLSLANEFLIDSPAPSNISYIWNFGSLLGVCLVIQILTGVTLAMHYCPSIDLAFTSVEHIMRDVNNGWIIRYMHSNTAGFFFIFIYLHMGQAWPSKFKRILIIILLYAGNVLKLYARIISANYYILYKNDIINMPYSEKYIMKSVTTDWTQSAGNILINGSSETIRKMSNEIFEYWLGGYIFNHNKINKNSIEIIEKHNNIKTLYKIKKYLGFGIIIKRIKTNTIKLRIYQQQDIIKILNILNHKTIINNKLLFLYEQYRIIPYSITIINFYNTWLAGFCNSHMKIIITKTYKYQILIKTDTIPPFYLKNINNLIKLKIYEDDTKYHVINNISEILKLFKYLNQFKIVKTNINFIHYIKLIKFIVYLNRGYDLAIHPFNYKINHLLKLYNKMINFNPFSNIRQIDSPNFYNNKINPWFITGLIEAEGCFLVTIDKRSKESINNILSIEMLNRDLDLLELVKKYFNCGTIYNNNKTNTTIFRVSKKSDINNIIIPHFNKYPLRGTKYLEYLDWVKIMKLRNTPDLDNKIFKITEIIKGMNSKRTDFYEPLHTLENSNNYIPLNSNYISGFIEGDGSFSIIINGKQIGSLSFSLIQHKNNISLLNSIKSVLLINSKITSDSYNKNVIRIQSNSNKYWKIFLIPFFIKFPLYGNKLIQLYKVIKILQYIEYCHNNVIQKDSKIINDLWYTDYKNIQMDLIINEYKKLNNPISYNAKIIIVTNIKNNNVIKYDSILEVSKNFNISRKTIRKYLNSNKPYKDYLFTLDSST